MQADGYRQIEPGTPGALGAWSALDWIVAFVVFWIWHVCNPRRQWRDDDAA